MKGSPVRVWPSALPLYSESVRHAVLGTGGVGGLIAGALKRAGGDVLLLMRPETLARYAGRLTVESSVLGSFDVDVPAAAKLEREVDALWIAVKATGLEEALGLAARERVAAALVVPLLNGVDHFSFLRTRYRNVVAAAIRVESERVAAWRIVQRSPFLRVDLAAREPLVDELRAAGVDARVRLDERTLLWEKLAFLAPFALAT